MKRASERFSVEEKESVAKAVARAEGKTSAEIVPVVATASGRYDRPEDTVGLWVGLAALVIVWSVLPARESDPGSWGGSPAFLEGLALLASVLVGFLAGATAASHIGWLRHLFTPRRQMLEEVGDRARQVFFDSRVHHTEGSTGLLLYVSLFERMASVLADEATTEKLGSPALEEICEKLTARLRSGTPAEAFCEAIEEVGERLSKVLPREEGDVNELPDALVLLD
jgi:putative membrane protein